MSKSLVRLAYNAYKKEQDLSVVAINTRLSIT